MDDTTAAPDGDPLLTRALDALRGLMLVSENRRQRVADQAGIAMSDLTAMSYLRMYDGLGAGDLGHLLGVPASSVTSVVDRLEARGLVERRRDQVDRRRVTMHVTAAGAVFVDGVRTYFARASPRFRRTNCSA